MKSVSGKTVCVTGAGGFIGSWIVKLLLEKGYNVRGTVRCLDDAKISHLIELPGAKERLNLYKADILHYERLFDVINGCDGVFHTACPVSNDQEAVVEAAVNGTKNVILAAANAKVGRVIFTSSFGALHMDPNRNPEAVIDESYWSDLDFCKNSKNWYCYGKTLAEKAAWELAEEKGVDLVTVIPVVVIGPYLQPSLNISNSHIQQYVNGSTKTYPNAMQAYVHVKDVASAHILVYETESAFGRYICAEAVLHRRELVEILSMLFPGYPTPTKSLDDKRARGKPFKLSNTRIKELGLVCTPIKQCLYETVKSLQEKGHLAVLPQQEVNIESTITHSSMTVQPAA